MTVPSRYKFYYIYGSSGHGNAPNLPESTNRCSYYEQNGGHKTHFSNNCGWTNWFGDGQPSDGSWKMVEMYLKYESGVGMSDGIYRLWIDDILVINATNVEHGIGDFWTIFVGSNIHNSGYNKCYGIDYDDIVVITDHNNSNLIDDGNGNLHIGPKLSGSDITAPTIPTNLVATPISSSQINLSWSASMDAVGVIGYNIYRCTGSFCTPTILINTAITNSYSDIGLLANTTYTYAVSAYDIVPNTSANSSTINQTTQSSASAPSITLFQESFEDSNFSGRGWYDGINLKLSTIEKYSGNSSVEYHFLLNGTTPEISGGSIRKLFTDTDEIYVRYYIKHSSNWTGSNKNYHPHEFLILTNENGVWDGPAYTHLTAYIEENEGVPQLGLQDGQNIDLVNLNQDLINITENRSTSGCNGIPIQENVYTDSCYSVGGGIYWNGRDWRANQIYFSDTPGAYYKNNWHKVEAYFKLNTISNGKGQSDGIIQYWYDNQLIINQNNIIMRTAQYPNMKFNQFMIAPYIGDGSPVDQTFWVDDLVVGTSRSTFLINSADVDQQNGINTIDALLTLRHFLGLSMNGTAWQASANTGDVNCDGNVNSTDAMLILRYSLGLNMNGTSWCK